MFDDPFVRDARPGWKIVFLRKMRCPFSGALRFGRFATWVKDDESEAHCDSTNNE